MLQSNRQEIFPWLWISNVLVVLRVQLFSLLQSGIMTERFTKLCEQYNLYSHNPKVGFFTLYLKKNVIPIGKGCRCLTIVKSVRACQLHLGLLNYNNLSTVPHKCGFHQHYYELLTSYSDKLVLQHTQFRGYSMNLKYSKTLLSNGLRGRGEKI